MINKGRPFQIMLHLCDYFEKNIQNNDLFQEEFLASRSINNLIEGQEELSDAVIQQIVDIIHDTESKKHYNGSGWLDYKNHVLLFLKSNGFVIDYALLFKRQ